MTTLHARAAQGVTLPEALAATAFPTGIALLSAPHAHTVARVTDGHCRTREADPYDLSAVFEARVFDGERELRWLCDTGDRGRAVLLTEDETLLPATFPEPVTPLSATAALTAHYLLWGRPAGGDEEWTVLHTPESAPSPSPTPGPAPNSGCVSSPANTSPPTHATATPTSARNASCASKPCRRIRRRTPMSEGQNRTGTLTWNADTGRLTVAVEEEKGRRRRVRLPHDLADELRDREPAQLDGMRVEFLWHKSNIRDLRPYGAPPAPPPPKKVAKRQFINPYTFLPATPATRPIPTWATAHRRATTASAPDTGRAPCGYASPPSPRCSCSTPPAPNRSRERTTTSATPSCCAPVPSTSPPPRSKACSAPPTRPSPTPAWESSPVTATASATACRPARARRWCPPGSPTTAPT